jgi:type II secretory pathway component GspD/PulD (secretin)
MKNVLLIGLILFTVVAELPAQSPSPAGPPTAVDVASLKVRVVLSRYQGDKRVSTTPFEMSVRSDGAKGQLRMGNEVPVPFVRVSTDPKQTDVPPGSLSYNYRPVGTNIDVTASPGANGRFRLDILLEDSSVVLDKTEPAPTPALAGAPIFRSFRTTNTLLLRDGESAEFTAATDRITGDTIRVSVSLTVMK